MPFEAIMIRDPNEYDTIYAFVSCESWGIPLIKEIVKNAVCLDDIWEGLNELEEREHLVIDVFDSWEEIYF